MAMGLKEQITDDMKTAMRAKEAAKLGTIRLILAEIKRREVDERIELDDEQTLAIIEKMIKQRKDSISQFEAGNRADLADIEKAELVILAAYMPAGLSEEEIAAEVAAAVTASGAAGPQDMGKVMGLLKAKLPKGTDMSAVSGLIKKALAPA
ncbi:GatB/YqeY domain-containing protein [Massilia antarctica]|uniref:GatB/YqeY domain-containing protein n=2 Tax=Massilia antarctica TaxID=2765360 RepID=A0AA48WJV7_9BURK|nr:GatB/YqeY domain-containing protein [Massilia sp. H27-R4]QPI53053.1 GatB/YqeY domain-containing protein [Massilia antarctica]